MITPEEFQFLEENEIVLRVSTTVTKETKIRFYEIYNRIFDTNKRPNACGRCFSNVVKSLKHYYENYQKID